MTTLLTTLQAATLTISLNRPERANAFNFEMIAELQTALRQAAKDAQVRCVVLTGTGGSFCAGMTSTEMLAARTRRLLPRTPSKNL